MPDGMTLSGIEREADETSGRQGGKPAWWKNDPNESLYQNTINDRSRNNRFAELENLAVVFAHEVADPLSGLSASLQFVLKGLSEVESRDAASNDVIRKIVEGALREVERLVRLLDDFRSAAPLAMNLKLTDLRQVITEVLAIEKIVYESSGVLVNLSFEDDLPSIEVDRAKMKQVILNLCKNAVEAMANGGRLGIDACRVDRNLVVEITDDGFGVPDDIDVFELFKTTKSGGTGLGLPVVRQIVAAHGGTVNYRSNRRGTTFTMRLPVSR